AARPAPPAPPPPEPSPRPVPRPAKPAEPRPKEPAPRPPAAKPAPSPPSPAPPSPAATQAAEGPGASIAAVGHVGAWELAWYAALVGRALYDVWQRPLLEGSEREIEVTVLFEIQRDGSVRDVRLSGESGVPSLDRSALRAVADAQPLPRLPPNWSRP